MTGFFRGSLGGGVVRAASKQLTPSEKTITAGISGETKLGLG